jgi:hypothetical protein
MTTERKAQMEEAIARAQRTLADLGKSVRSDPPARPLAKRIAAMVGEALTGELTKLADGADGTLHPMGKVTATAATAEPFSPEVLRKVSAMVGFEVDAALAEAALADDTPVGRFLAVRGIRLEDPADALPSALLKALGVDPAREEERLAKAAAAHKERAERIAASRRAGFIDRLRAEATRAEAHALLRGDTETAVMAKAAGASASSIFDVSKAIPPIRTTPWTAHRDGYTDRRAELRRLRDLQLEIGNREGAALTNKELAAEEIKVTQRGIPAMWWPTGTPVAPEAQS